MSFVEALKIASSVMEAYRIDQPKWWKQVEGTPILNDIPVRMATAFIDPAAAKLSQQERPPLTIDGLITSVKMIECPDCGRRLRIIISTSLEAAK